MSLDRLTCLDQLERFAGLPGYPKLDAAKRSLIDALVTFPTDAALRAWADDVLRNCDRCPIPRDAYRGAYDARPVAGAGHQRGYRCTVCYDTGHVEAPHLITFEAGGGRRIERLTLSQEAELWQRHREAEARGDVGATLRPGRQYIYEVPVPCGCSTGPARLAGTTPATAVRPGSPQAP